MVYPWVKFRTFVFSGINNISQGLHYLKVKLYTVDTVVKHSTLFQTVNDWKLQKQYPNPDGGNGV